MARVCLLYLTLHYEEATIMMLLGASRCEVRHWWTVLQASAATLLRPEARRILKGESQGWRHYSRGRNLP